MGRDEIVQILRTSWKRMQDEFGVQSLTIFGSVARNEATDTSDVDLLVEFGRPTGFFGLVRLQFFLEDLLDCRVDLGTLSSLRPEMRQRVASEAIRVG